MKKEYVIPIFVPHKGCPNDCIFCNQRKISGQLKEITAQDVKQTIEYYLSNFKDDNKYVEVAFFGGSFTGIDIEKQQELLEAANEYVKAGKVRTIRISTRPDYINKHILKFLKKYNVKTIELAGLGQPLLKQFEYEVDILRNVSGQNEINYDILIQYEGKNIFECYTDNSDNYYPVGNIEYHGFQ